MRLVSKWKHGTYRFRWRCESRCWSFGALKDFVGVHSAVIRNCQRDCSAPDKCVSVADNRFCSQQLRADVRHQELTLDIVIMHTRHNILSLMFCHSNTISSVIFDRHFLRLFPIFQTLCMVPSLSVPHFSNMNNLDRGGLRNARFPSSRTPRLLPWLSVVDEQNPQHASLSCQ